MGHGQAVKHRWHTTPDRQYQRPMRILTSSQQASVQKTGVDGGATPQRPYAPPRTLLPGSSATRARSIRSLPAAIQEMSPAVQVGQIFLGHPASLVRIRSRLFRLSSVRATGAFRGCPPPPHNRGASAFLEKASLSTGVGSLAWYSPGRAISSWAVTLPLTVAGGDRSAHPMSGSSHPHRATGQSWAQSMRLSREVIMWQTNIGLLHGCSSSLSVCFFARSLQIGLEKVCWILSKGDNLQIIVQIRVHRAGNDEQLLILTGSGSPPSYGHRRPGPCSRSGPSLHE